ncbi:MAG: ThuA domain-containing protein [Cypionkella sp.]|uniref:ThuA domain-containing protein n=1 Tax=Cypionkella sp. TaxID=2811411 RepID=UPI002ABCA376|nr:ThuA domain-containing protein [Cypionkella sp.]MDZ4310436.1 ThuA domain-containing protein [Cypionkella sp.]MDZ4393995.1 ThuA domain-containing protein [Cypionkella sp.]
MTKALITWGGWDGHQPDKVAAFFAEELRAAGMQVEVTDSLSCFDDPGRLADLSLIVPVWTMSSIEKHQSENVAAAVAAGVGLAGCHGGMCDAFRTDVLWQFMTGAQWVAHPGNDGVTYRVRMVSDDPLVAGIADFDVATEQYYLHIDPAVRVHAVCDFPVVAGPHSPNGPVAMPIVFSKLWGQGRVYYNALGHQTDVINHGPARELLRRGLLWAAKQEG